MAAFRPSTQTSSAKMSALEAHCKDYCRRRYKGEPETGQET